jgi:hypothetical protein
MTCVYARAGALLMLFISPRQVLAAGEVLAKSLAPSPSFEANHGQLAADGEFWSHGNGFEVLLSGRGATLTLAPRAVVRSRSHLHRGGPRAPRPVAGVGIGLTFTGATGRAVLRCAEPAPGVANYLLGADPARWRRGVPLCRRVEARGLYPGVDLLWHFGSEGLEWDLRALPAADLRAVRLRIDGAAALTVDERGDLVIQTLAGPLRQRRPVVVGGGAASVSYLVLGPREVGLRVARRDPRRALLIDPELSFSSFLGGSDSEGVGPMARDESGNIYVAGFTFSTDFPTVAPFEKRRPKPLAAQIFVSKIDPRRGSLIYSTYLGGNAANGVSGIAVDAAGNIVVGGYTYSTDFPRLNAFEAGPKPAVVSGYGTGFLTKLDAAGSALVFSTFVGGSHGSDGVTSVAVDRDNNIVFTGDANSDDFPTLPPAFPCTLNGLGHPFVAKVDRGGTLLYSTCLSGLGLTFGGDLALDALGNAYIGGATYAGILPVTPGAFQTSPGGDYDGYVAKFSSTGRLIYLTYLGGPFADEVSGIAVDATGSAVVVSATAGDFPLVNPFQRELEVADADGFPDGMAITKLSPSGSTAIYSTYLGGSGADSPGSISVGPLGDACVAGNTVSRDYPLVKPIQRENAAFHGDAFISRLSPDGSRLLFSTFLGGSDISAATSILCDPWGDILVAGWTSAKDFPVKNAFQPRFGGNSTGLNEGDGFVATITSDPQPVTLSPLSLMGGRFLVEAIWSNRAALLAGTGEGAALSGDSGYFSFFDPGNLELVVKIVDGRKVNGNFWFFYGALTDVEYWLRLIDTSTGAVHLYHNPSGHLASVADTAAFTVGAASNAAQGTGLDPARGIGRGAVQRTGSPAGPGGGCGQGSLCLQDGRFEVRVSWQVAGLGAGTGTGVPLATGDDSGTFWFFSPDEVELALKILDGRAINGNFWVYYGALSDVEYDVAITDTVSGATKSYHNPAGRLASVADTTAFPGP